MNPMRKILLIIVNSDNSELRKQMIVLTNEMIYLKEWEEDY